MNKKNPVRIYCSPEFKRTIKKMAADEDKSTIEITDDLAKLITDKKEKEKKGEFNDWF